MSKKDELFDIVEPQMEESDVVELFDENGNPVAFNIIATLEVEDEEYAILSNVDDDEEVLIFRVSEDADEFVFETIEDEEELQSVIEAYNELLEEMDED